MKEVAEIEGARRADNTITSLDNVTDLPEQKLRLGRDTSALVTRLRTPGMHKASSAGDYRKHIYMLLHV